MNNIIPENEIISVVNKAESTLSECFDMLLSIKNNDYRLEHTLKSFQPTLADCLYSLMSVYHKLKEQQRYLIEQKEFLQEESFTEYARNNAENTKLIRECISIGFSLGDAFAWLFFYKNRDELDYHLSHPSTGLFPSNIGGKGEIEFLKHNTTIDGLYVVYHGITDMLRIGDYSLFESTHGIVGNGEIKTRKINNNELEINTSIYSKLDIRMPDVTQSASLPDDSLRRIINEFPSLLRQMKKQERLLSLRESDYSSAIISKYEYDMVNNLSLATPISINSDDSVLLYAVWSKYQHLYDVLSRKETEKYPKEFSENIRRIIRPKSDYNAIYYGVLDLNMLPSRIPIFWWKINDSICREIYFKRVMITSFYNPALLIDKFIDHGFKVVSFGEANEIKLAKETEKKKFEYDNLQLYMDLIGKGLMNTESAFEIAYEVISAVEKDEIPINSSTNINIHIHTYNE